jgi:hypothetical protein
VEETLLSPGQKDAQVARSKDPLVVLTKHLSEEYEDQPEDKINEAAKHALDRFADARIRDFVGVFAWRHASKHLRQAS